MTWHVVCAAPPLSIPNDDLSIEAAELGHANAEVSPHICTSEAELEQAAASVDGLVTIGLGLSRQTLVALDRCRAIITVSHGFNHIDIAAATELGIPWRRLTSSTRTSPTTP